MEKILISLPEQLVMRMRATIQDRQRSKVITGLIEAEVKKREQILYKCALSLEKDTKLHKEMAEWNVTLKDGLSDESW